MIKDLAYARIPSFRRERGGLFAIYVTVRGRLHRALMRWHHRGAGILNMPICEMAIEDAAVVIRVRNDWMQRHCRARLKSPSPGISPRCGWCGRKSRKTGYFAPLARK